MQLKNQKNLREKAKWTPVQKLMDSVIKNVLKPFKQKDSEERRKAYEERNRLAHNLRQRLRIALKAADAEKYEHTLDIVGCTMEEYNAHMHSQLPPGASMKDMSCDHIFFYQ